MWKLVLKLQHDCTISQRCKKFGCTCHSLSLNARQDEQYEYTSQKHYIFGSDENVQKFIKDLKTDKRIVKLKTYDHEIYFTEKRVKEKVPSSYYQQNIFFVKPVFSDIDGWETWKLVSREKIHLESFLQHIENIDNVIIKQKDLQEYTEENKLLTLDNDNNIVKRTEGERDQRLSKQLMTGHIEGDQWFRDFHERFIIAFNNPYSFKYPNSELYLLYSYQSEIFPYIKDHVQIHYGVGVGETELELVRWQLESNNHAEICAIDINNVFLELFLENLKDKSLEHPKSTIIFKGYNTSFQNTIHHDFQFSNAKYKHALHICIGGTIGNFNPQDEIWNIFKYNMDMGDMLLLGFQLDTHIEIAFEKYKQNKFYPKFVLNYLDEEIDHDKIIWNYDKNTGFITMEYDDIEVFRTRKYDIDILCEELKAFGFSSEKYRIDPYRNSCIALFKKVA